jgi:sulfatase maturation enzyme AslB (radical SAM superfamily)
MTEKIYCALTHTGVFTNNNGEALPCCASRIKPTGVKIPTEMPIHLALENRLNAPVIKEIRQKLIDGVWPTECSMCKTNEDIGVKSMRQSFNELISEPDVLKAELKLEDIKTLHMGVGNKCNSKCMTCEPHSSDQWVPEYEFINDRIFTRKYVPILDQSGGVDELVNNLPNLARITFLGGEPTISDKYQDMLNAFVKTGASKNIDLGFVTNLTTVDEMINDWIQFKSVDISVSIDGFGKINEYIRYPIKWEKTVSNLKSLLEHFDDNTFRVGLSLTPSVYNCLHLDDMIKFWYDITTEFNARQIISLNKVTYPISASMRVVPIEYRKLGVTNLLNLKNAINDNFIHSVIDSLIVELEEPELPNRELHISHLKKFITKSDLYRHRTIKDYIPELYDELYTK